MNHKEIFKSKREKKEKESFLKKDGKGLEIHKVLWYDNRVLDLSTC